jgi:hypothetical protein
MQIIAVVAITAAEQGMVCRRVFCGKPFKEGDTALLLLDRLGGLSVHCPRHHELPRRADPLVAEEDGTVAWVCRLGGYHEYDKHDDEDCPHMRAHDDDYCSACAPYQCHHEHDHP